MLIERRNVPGRVVPRGYSHVVVTNSLKTVHLAGMAALSEEGVIPEGSSLHEQTRLTVTRILDTLELLGADPVDMVRRTTYIVDLTEDKLEVVQQVYAELFGPDVLPAATALGVASLARPNMLIEIECTVAVA